MSKKKSKQLGMPFGTASGRLRKNLLFRLVVQLGFDTCYCCDKQIECARDLSIDHIVPWLDSDDPIGLFFDQENIAFSHLSCNSAAGSKPIGRTHGLNATYLNAGCRCTECREAHTKWFQDYRSRKRLCP